MNISDQPLDEFLSAIASERVTPAGGSAAAVVGAIGAALPEMVCIHTVEKAEYEAVAPDLADVRDQLRRERSNLLGLAETDARVISDLFPAADDGLDQTALKQSTGVPLTIAEACLNVLQLATVVIETGNRNAVADAVTGVFFARSALQAAVFTARSNVDHVSDPAFVATIERRTDEIEIEADEACERTMEYVDERA